MTQSTDKEPVEFDMAVCTSCQKLHGVITFDTLYRMVCFSKQTVYECLDGMLSRRMITEAEKAALLQQVDASPLVQRGPEMSLLIIGHGPLMCVPADSQTPILRVRVDESLAAELCSTDTSEQTLH